MVLDGEVEELPLAVDVALGLCNARGAMLWEEEAVGEGDAEGESEALPAAVGVRVPDRVPKTLTCQCAPFILAASGYPPGTSCCAPPLPFAGFSAMQ